MRVTTLQKSGGLEQLENIKVEIVCRSYAGFNPQEADLSRAGWFGSSNPNLMSERWQLFDLGCQHNELLEFLWRYSRHTKKH